MKIRLFCCLILPVIFFQPVSPSLANEGRVYFLSAHPTPKTNEVFPAALHSSELSKGGLNFEREVLSENTGSEKVFIDYDRRVIVIDLFGQGVEKDAYVKRFEIINMDVPHKVRTIEVSYPKLIITKKFLFDLPGKGLYVGLILSGIDSNIKKRIMKFRAGNLVTGKQEFLEWQDYKFFRVSGIAGVASLFDDVMGSVFVAKDDEFMLHVGKERVKSGIKFTKKISLSEKDKVAVFVNNDEILAITPVKKRVKDVSKGSTTFDILNKSDNSWSSLKVKGGRTGVRGFGHWMGGYIEYKGHGKPSAGKEKRKDSERKTVFAATSFPESEIGKG